jgi:hypothetical protein
MNEDVIAQQLYEREQTRQHKHKRFKDKQQAVGVVFLKIYATGLLQPYMDTLNDNRFRWVWTEIEKTCNGPAGGVDNSVSLLDEIGAYVYCCEHDFEDNLTYVNRLGAMVSYADDYKMVVLVRGIERSKIHIEMKTVARLHKHLPASTYDILVLALRTTYSQLPNSNSIKVITLKSSALIAIERQEALHVQVAERQEALFAAALALGGGQGGGRGEGRGGHGGREGRGGRQGSQMPDGGRLSGKRSTDTRLICTFCGLFGHEHDTCFKKHPCTKCGSNKHGNWNHNDEIHGTGDDGEGVGHEGLPDMQGGLSQSFTSHQHGTH